MSIRLIAKALYTARPREAALADAAATADGSANTSRLADALRQARAERRRLEATLAGHIDRGPGSN